MGGAENCIVLAYPYRRIADRAEIATAGTGRKQQRQRRGARQPDCRTPLHRAEPRSSGRRPKAPFVAKAPQREANCTGFGAAAQRSEEHTSELQSLMRISYAVFCLTKKNKQR